MDDHPTFGGLEWDSTRSTRTGGLWTSDLSKKTRLSAFLSDLADLFCPKEVLGSRKGSSYKKDSNRKDSPCVLYEGSHTTPTRRSSVP